MSKFNIKIGKCDGAVLIGDSANLTIGATQGIPQEQHVPRETTTTTVHSPCQETGDDINYKAKSGYVLVINNYIFPKRPDGERHWSGEDVKGLKSLFDDFNFTTKIYDNLEQREIKGLLQDTSEKDFGRYDCFVCVILSHGSKDRIYGTDDISINIEAITSCFFAK
ncbi:unnamed protein product [Pocillopora meandrina]|uniref:Caspase family p20 domain-containing protein n=1 Tax=Pocillopora meandrina TaxID=46732 RepID=A0AAU9Y308_9CNID|nr:unnamed protein product [Pocillopora meandrina]